MSTERNVPFACLALAMLPLAWAGLALAADRTPADAKSGAMGVERGRYLVRIGGCNDCHTPGYAPAGGKVEEKLWLTGDTIGWRGPWGTTYPANLRLYVQGLNEDQWVERTKRGEARPPMPWFNLHAMTDGDLRAMYRYIKALGPAGDRAPAYVPPGEEPVTPYFVLSPQLPQPTKQAAKVSSR